jgi:hypothetical protein
MSITFLVVSGSALKFDVKFNSALTRKYLPSFGFVPDHIPVHSLSMENYKK